MRPLVPELRDLLPRGEFRQRELWTSTLPLGHDSARRTRKYATRNAADTVPLVGTGCGSPGGIPFAFADPGRTLERLDPYDPEHANHTLLICGRSGSGKTMTANLLLARLIACGARAFVIDRAGHYELLTRLVAGAQQIELGAARSAFALNPWDVPDPARVSSEKVAFLLSLHTLMMGEEGLTTLARAQLGFAGLAPLALLRLPLRGGQLDRRPGRGPGLSQPLEKRAVIELGEFLPARGLMLGEAKVGERNQSRFPRL